MGMTEGRIPTKPTHTFSDGPKKRSSFSHFVRFRWSWAAEDLNLSKIRRIVLHSICHQLWPENPENLSSTVGVAPRAGPASFLALSLSLLLICYSLRAVSADFPFPACDRIGRERKKITKKYVILPSPCPVNCNEFFDRIFVPFFLKRTVPKTSRSFIWPKDPWQCQSQKNFLKTS